MKKLTFFASLFYLALPLFCQNDAINPERQWSVYRGPHSRGFLDNVNLPDTWDVGKSKNIKWKRKIPGLAHSGPVIWGDKVFLTTAVSQFDTYGIRTGIYGEGEPVKDESEHYYIVYCIDRNTGKIIWERIAYHGIPEVKRHPKSTHANSTPVTDGKYVVAFFGSEGLYCYDMNGNLVWEKDFGRLDAGAFNADWAEWEFGSSPVIHKGVVIVQCDVRGYSFLAAFEADTGKEIWRKTRDEYPTWCTPNIYEVNGRDIVVVNGYIHRGGYDFKTGEEVWKMSGGGDVPIPTPVIGEELIYFNSAHGRMSPIYAIRKTARDDISLDDGETHNDYIKWCIPRGGAYMHSLLLYDGYLYNMRWNGQLQCINPETGEMIYREKIGQADSFIASLVAADGKIYIISDEGDVYTIQAGSEFKLLNETALGEICMVVPAISDGMIIFRTQNQLIATGR